MRTKTLVVLIAIAILGVSSAAMAKGSGGGGGGGKGWSGGGHFGHNHFGHNRFDRRFLRNQFFLNGWGWDWGLAPYDNSGYGGNTTVVAFPVATPQVANGSVPATPCHWNAETFTVPSSTGGAGPVQVVSCR
jgi:hypothetical protein